MTFNVCRKCDRSCKDTDMHGLIIIISYLRLKKIDEEQAPMGLRASKLSRIFKSNNGDGVKLLKSSSMTRRGYVPVCVGVNEETKRFMVHRNSLQDTEFAELLCRSAEEYGFRNQGVLRIAYDAKDFEDWMVRRRKRKILRVSPA